VQQLLLLVLLLLDRLPLVVGQDLPFLVHAANQSTWRYTNCIEPANRVI
jgi:hypothetical protein